MEDFNYPTHALFNTVPSFLAVFAAIITVIFFKKEDDANVNYSGFFYVFYVITIISLALVLTLAILPCASIGSMPFLVHISVIALSYSMAVIIKKKSEKLCHLLFAILTSGFVLYDAIDNKMDGWIIAIISILLGFVILHMTIAIIKFSSTAKTNGPIIVLWFVLLSSIVAGYFIMGINPPKTPKIGTVHATAGQTGAGPKKRSITFHLYEEDGSWMPFNDWSDLDADEKIRVKAKFSGDDVKKQEPIKDGGDKDYVYLGIERKGKDRSVPNLNMECLQRDDEDEFDYGGEDCSFFDHFENKYEDWWIVMGGPADETHYRQMFANELFEVPYVLLDVFTQHNSTVKTFEGVGMLLPAFKKDLYSDLFGEERKGKIKCKDQEVDAEDGPALMKYEEGNSKENFWTKRFTSRVFEPDWEEVYPKKHKLDECTITDKKRLIEKYQTRIQELANASTLSEIESEPIDHEDFAKTWIWEMLLQDTDFAFRSQNFALYDPKANERADDVSPKDDLILGPNFLWDYNAAGYRGRESDEKFSILNLYPFFGWDDPVPMFKAICDDSTKFLQKHSIVIADTLSKASDAAKKVNDILTNADMTHSLDLAFSKRNDRGKKRIGDILDTHMGKFANYHFKKTVKEEIAYHHTKMLNRIAYVTNNWKTTQCEYKKKMGSLKVFMTLLIVFFYIFTILISLLFCNAQSYNKIKNIYEGESGFF